MRDPQRIKPFLDKIEKYWSKVPDWRFGQFIENVKRMMGEKDLFYVEDQKFAEKLYEIFELDPEEVKENSKQKEEEEIEDVLNTI